MRATIMLFLLCTLSPGKVIDTPVCDGINDAISLIVQHKKQIQEKIYYQELTPTTYHAGIEIRNRLSVIIDSMVYGKRGPADKELVRGFINYRHTFTEAVYGTQLLYDTISVQFLSNLLRCNDEDLFGSVKQYLSEETSFDVLKSQSNHIKNNLLTSPFKNRAFTLLSLLNLTKEEKNSIISANVPLYIKANTGDTASMDSLISRYKNEMDLGSKSIMAAKILSTGQTRGLIAVLKDFPKPIYSIVYENTPYACTTSIIKNGVMSFAGLRRYYPKDSLFTKEFERVHASDFRSAEGNVLLIKFWNKLEVWFWEHYKIQIEKKPPHSNMFRGCYNSAFRLPPVYRK